MNTPYCAAASSPGAIWIQAVIVALLIVLGQSGTSVHGAYNVLIEMMVVIALAVVGLAPAARDAEIDSPQCSPTTFASPWC